jgi:hypothetical protein
MRRRRRYWLPGWVTAPLALLGVVYIVTEPLFRNLGVYFVALWIAFVVGLYYRRRWKVTVLERSNDHTVVRLERRHD